MLIQIVLGLCFLDYVGAVLTAQQIFSPAALLIVYREVLEGCIVVSVMLNALHKIGATKKKKWVWIGAATGLLLSILAGSALVALFWAASQDLFSGYSASVFEGILSTFGSTMVTLVSFKLLKFSDLEGKWEAKLKSRGAEVLNSAVSGVLTESEMEQVAGTNTEIFLVIFTTVVREGLETAIFIGGVGAGALWTSLPMSAFVGVVLGMGTGLAIVYGGRKVENMAWFFYASCVFMFFIGAGLAATAAFEIEAIYSESALMAGSVVIGTPLWSIKACCDETQVGTLDRTSPRCQTAHPLPLHPLIFPLILSATRLPGRSRGSFPSCGV